MTDKRALFAVAATLLSAATAGALGVAAGWQYVALGAVLCSAILLFVWPVDWLPSIALALFALVPVLYMPVNSLNGTLTPGLIVLLVWAARVIGQRDGLRLSGRILIPIGLMTLWLVIATVSSLRVQSSFLWTVCFVVLVCVPGALLPSCPSAAVMVLSTWSRLAALLGGFAILEWVARFNPIFEALPSATNLVEIQQTGIYRVTTTLGHPLVNGTFFSIAAVIALARLLAAPSRVALAYVLLPLAGVAGSASRGAVLAVVIGAVACVLGMLISGTLRISSRGLGVLVAVLCVATPLIYLLLSFRAATGNSAGSTDVRLATYQVGTELAHKYWPWGAGPGLADDLKRSYFIGDQRRGIESSWLQLAVSQGLVGIALLTWSILTAALSAFRRRPNVAGALVAYSVGASFYNLLEGNRPALILLGLLLGCAAAPIGGLGGTCSQKTPDREKAVCGIESLRSSRISDSRSIVPSFGPDDRLLGGKGSRGGGGNVQEGDTGNDYEPGSLRDLRHPAWRPRRLPASE